MPGSAFRAGPSATGFRHRAGSRAAIDLTCRPCPKSCPAQSHKPDEDLGDQDPLSKPCNAAFRAFRGRGESNEVEDEQGQRQRTGKQKPFREAPPAWASAEQQASDEKTHDR